MQKFFITATGTGVGKTLVTTSICYQAMSAGKKIAAIKPVISGYAPDDTESDIALILQSLNLPVTTENIQAISPWRFYSPLAPNMAAAKEGRNISLEEVVAFCKAREKSGVDILLAEGVGGVCVPLNDKYTVLDWMEQLSDWKIILVAGSYLGSISHTLTSVQAVTARGVKLHSLVVSESENSSVTLADTVETLSNFIEKSVPIISVPRQEKCDKKHKKLCLEIPELYEVHG